MWMMDKENTGTYIRSDLSNPDTFLSKGFLAHRVEAYWLSGAVISEYRPMIGSYRSIGHV